MKQKKNEKPYRFLKGSKDLLTPINGKSINWTPSEILRISLRGIKHFEAKKNEKLYRFLKSSKDLLTPINGKSINWTPRRYCVSPFGGQNTSIFFLFFFGTQSNSGNDYGGMAIFGKRNLKYHGIHCSRGASVMVFIETRGPMCRPPVSKKP